MCYGSLHCMKALCRAIVFGNVESSTAGSEGVVDYLTSCISILIATGFLVISLLIPLEVLFPTTLYLDSFLS